ncbi:MAG: prolyl oligopeptidase family serine peptidase [Clostridia bacterium]|nr:prolyl oligopeptidase family serine peptidase [Clostridia bacterium]
MKRVLLSILLLALVLVVASCSGGIEAATGVESQGETAEPSTTLEIVKNGNSKYTVVHDGTDEAKDFATKLSSYLKLKFAASLEVTSSSQGDGRYEITVGSVGSIGEEAKKKLAAPFDFSLTVEEDRLNFSAKSKVSYNYLFEYLKRDVLVRGTSADLILTPGNNMQYSTSELSKTTYVDYLRADNKALDPDVFFDAGVFQHENTRLLYRCYIPSTYSAEKEYPIFVNLHGAGIRGSDNKRPLSFVKELFKNEKYDLDEYIVLVPQCPENEKWVDITWKDGSYDLSEVPESNEFAALVALIESMKETYSIDESRIWAAGFSMGGYGTWNLLINHPDLFCAGVPMCGAGAPASAERVLNTPVWAVHGVKDPTVPVSGSREMVEAIRNLGGTLVRYTELPEHDHNVWDYTYTNEEIFTWLFSQKK